MRKVCHTERDKGSLWKNFSNAVAGKLGVILALDANVGVDGIYLGK